MFATLKNNNVSNELFLVFLNFGYPIVFEIKQEPLQSNKNSKLNMTFYKQKHKYKNLLSNIQLVTNLMMCWYQVQCLSAMFVHIELYLIYSLGKL